MTTVDAKQVVGRYWGGRAATFDEDAFHSIGSPAEAIAWNRVLDLLAPPGRALDVLDVGCGTGFLALLFAARGHRVQGSDLAPEMIAVAQEKAARLGLPVTFSVDDAEAPALPDASVDLVVTRHLFWTLPHPEQALDRWIRVARPGGRVALVEGQWRRPEERDGRRQGALAKRYGEAVVEALPLFDGLDPAEAEVLLSTHGLRNARADRLDDLVEAQRARMTEEQRAGATYVRYVVFGDKP